MSVENRVAALEAKMEFALRKLAELAKVVVDGLNVNDENASRLAAGIFALINALGEQGIDSDKLTDQVRTRHPAMMAKLDQLKAIERDNDDGSDQ